jgi:hypothetical protein
MRPPLMKPFFLKHNKSSHPDLALDTIQHFKMKYLVALVAALG